MADFLSTLFGGGAEREAADRNRAAYQNYWDTGINVLNTGTTDARRSLNDALGSYDTLAGLAGDYRRGSDLYLDALGVNGADGSARATGAFQAGPGYEFTLNQGLDALNRRRARSGMLNSGNSDLDAIKYATGLADNTFGGWLDRLAGVDRNALAATGSTAAGQAGVHGSLADLSNLDAQNRIGLLTNKTSGDVSASNLQAQGESQGARNLLSAGMSLASLAAGGLGGGFGSFLGGAGGGGMGLGSGLAGMTTGRLY